MKHGYPSPQLQRLTWRCLNGPWRFCFGHDGQCAVPSDVANWPQIIEVPYPPESKVSGIGDQGFHKACWYQREADIASGNDRVILHFGAVDYAARVWVNNILVATHEGGHTPFLADITTALAADGTQTITIFAEDNPHELNKPRGKQDWKLEPLLIWYPRTSGIRQTVWFERVGHTCRDKLRWTTQMKDFSIGLEARLRGDVSCNFTLALELRHGERLLAQDRYLVVDGEVNRFICLSDPGIDDFRNELVWSPERPTLLDAKLTLWQGREIVDEIQSYTALRSAHVLRDRFMLNGRPYVLRMVLDQGYWPDSLLAAPDDDALRRDVELAKAMGFNGVRKHQKIEIRDTFIGPTNWGFWCGKKCHRPTGLAAQPSNVPSANGLKPSSGITATPASLSGCHLINRWGVPALPSVQAQRHAVDSLYHLTKTLDPRRAVIGNDGWESGATDIIGTPDYDNNIEHIRQRYGAEIVPADMFDRRRPGGRVLTLDGHPHRV